jgi:DNA-binding response OmpR family regulator
MVKKSDVSAREKRHILIVEDEKDMAYALRIQLESKGYSVSIACDGHDALQKARREHPDLIILDLMLPKIDGYKVCRMLKFDTKYADIPIIMFTARAQDIDMQMGKEVGADAYLTKPLKKRLLISKIKELLKE